MCRQRERTVSVQTGQHLVETALDELTPGIEHLLHRAQIAADKHRQLVRVRVDEIDEKALRPSRDRAPANSSRRSIGWPGSITMGCIPETSSQPALTRPICETQRRT